MEAEEQKGRFQLLKSSAIVSGMTMISRLFGLARDMVIAYFFGAAAGADAFFLAFRIPNFFRRLFAEGAFAQAFVPVLTGYKSSRSHEKVKELVDRTSGSLGLVLLLITLAIAITLLSPDELSRRTLVKWGRAFVTISGL